MFYYSDSALDWQYQLPKTSIVEKTTDYSVIRELKVIPSIALRISTAHDFTRDQAYPVAALTRSHLIGDHPSGLTKEQRTETWTLALKQKDWDPIPANEI